MGPEREYITRRSPRPRRGLSPDLTYRGSPNEMRGPVIEDEPDLDDVLR
jgi:hypothetical protein